MNKRLILASQSSRRRDFLSQLGYHFSCQPADIDESVMANESASVYVERMAKEKALKIFNTLPFIENDQSAENAVILGSDTCVIIDDEILAKPEDINDCIRILRLLSNKKHQVLTAIAVVGNNKQMTEVVATDVYFKALTTQEIIAYWHTGEPQDKAGAYGLQGVAGQFIKRIDGSYSAVIGLPLYETQQLLAEFGLVTALQSSTAAE